MPDGNTCGGASSSDNCMSSVYEQTEIFIRAIVNQCMHPMP